MLSYYLLDIRHVGWECQTLLRTLQSPDPFHTHFATSDSV